jgi:hypothetical protein
MVAMYYRLRPRIKNIFALILSSGAIILSSAPAVLAIAQGYITSDTGLQSGMVVSLSSDGADEQVERATQETSSRVVGISTSIEDSPVTISSASAQVLVESEGQVDVYVSDLGGSVKKGDLLVLSPLKGILMKGSDSTTLKVIGIAAQNINKTTTYPYQNGGETQETQIAKIKIDISALGSANSGITISESVLSRVGKTVVGREVGEIRVLIALVIFVIVLIAEGGIIYGAISSAITALGRNPFAKKVIRQEMVRVIFVAFGVLLVGLGAVYAILWI